MEEYKNPTSENREYLLIIEYVSRFAFSFYNLSSHIATSIYKVTLELLVQTYASDHVKCSLFLFDFNRK